MAYGITYSTSSYDRRAAARRTPAAQARAAGQGVATRVLAWLNGLVQRRPGRLEELPDALVDDVAPGRHSVAREAQAGLGGLDARLYGHLY